MIALILWALLVGVTAGAAVFLGWVLVLILDPIIGYRPEREDGRTPWPHDPEMALPGLVAVGPGIPNRRRRVVR